MTYEEAKNFVKQQLPNYLESKGISTRNNFNCLNPDHVDNDPSMSYDRARNKCHCFGCGADYDTFDLIGIDYGLSGKELFEKAFDLYRLTVEYDTSTQSHKSKHQAQPLDWNAEINREESHTDTPAPAPVSPALPKAVKAIPDTNLLTAAIDQAHAALMSNPAALDRLKSRGITLDTVQRHKIGYAAGGQNALLQGYNEQFRSSSRKAGLYQYIFPVLDSQGRCCYFVSEISDRRQVDEYNGKYRKLKNADQRFINEDCILQGKDKFIFICEGVYDALSIEQAGGQAIALIGVGGEDRIIELESRSTTNHAYIIALDSDQTGQKRAQALKDKFTKVGSTCIIYPLEGAKDANELLLSNPAALNQYVQNAVKVISTKKDRHDEIAGIVTRILEERDLDTAAVPALTEKAIEREDEAASYPRLSAAAQLQDFIDNIRKSENTPYFPTGFKELDELFDGGVYPSSLYFIGAISSLGKTTLTLQIADNIAAGGNDVLIFSLEMARDELIAKSVSRHTYIEDKRQYRTAAHAKTTRGILTGSRYKYYSAIEKAIITDAIKSYGKYAEHIYISEGVGDIGVKEISESIEKHIRVTGRKPVVIIDYMQILAPADVKASDKQNTDKAVLELKRLARDKFIPVIGISSFNRNSYYEPVSMAAFKESGAIEYSADALIAMQYLGMDYYDGESSDNRTKRIRELFKESEAKAKAGKSLRIQVKVLKNRNGSKGEAILDFYPMFNYFSDNTESFTLRLNAAKAPGKPKRQQELESLVTAFKEVEEPADSCTASLEALADRLDYKKTTLKGKLKEFTKHFSIKGDVVTYYPENPSEEDAAADQSEELAAEIEPTDQNEE